MTLDPATFRRLLTEPPTSDTANALKAWRERERFSQAEAAVNLGVSVRTLQGWEMGRPMPYPGLLERGMQIATRVTDPYTVVQSDFPREFAQFLDFVGVTDLDSAVRKVDQKLTAWSLDARSLFGDRFFFHEQYARFVDGPSPFRLELSDPMAVRAASLVVGINRVRQSLSSAEGAFRLRKMVIDNLKPDRDIRQIEHELRCSTHFRRKQFKVIFADLEGLGNFDLLVETPSTSVEVECKTITEETGAQIKRELIGDLSDVFIKTVQEKTSCYASGVFTVTLRRPAAECKNLASQVRTALQSTPGRSFHASDFSLDYSPRPQWQELLDSERLRDLRDQIALERADSDHVGYTIISGKIVAVVIRPHKPSMLSQRIVKTIKNGADQCTGQKPCVVWLHFVGVAQADFLLLAEFSREGKGAGLNAIVAESLHPEASSTDRSHVQSVWFTAGGGEIHRHSTFAPDLLMVPAVSSGGACYRVPNLCRFPPISDLD